LSHVQIFAGLGVGRGLTLSHIGRAKLKV
jgi:hypothetical protein